TRAVTAGAGDLSGAAPFDVTFPNAAPRITFVTPSLAGKAVRKVPPGAIVKVAGAVKDPDGDLLHYNWGDGTAGFRPGRAPAIDWKLPPMPGIYALNVEVSDGKGGFARGHATVAAGVEGELFSGVVTDRQSGAPIPDASVSINGKVVSTGK